MSASFEAIVVGLHLAWDGVWQRPNHLLARFARRVPVIVVEELRRGDRDCDEITSPDGVTRIRATRSDPDDAVDDALIATVHTALGARRPLVWLYTPRMLGLADAFPEAPLVYDKMDELASFLNADRRIVSRERELLERADLAFAGGRTLFRSIADRASSAQCYPSGVDVAHFARAQRPRPRPEAGRDARLGYVGVLDERLDLALIAEIARLRPDWTIELVGPVAKIDPAELPLAANIRYLGSRPYVALPETLAAFDVGIMPFAINEATLSISPTKTLEYLAAGLPVVSTRVADVVVDYDGIVRFADDAASFVEAAEAALAPDHERDRRAAERVRAGSWDAIADAMWADLARVCEPAPAR